MVVILLSNSGITRNLKNFVSCEEVPIDHIVLPYEPVQKSIVEETAKKQIFEYNKTLRPYQEEVLRIIRPDAGFKLVSMPCGSGKTLIACNHIRSLNPDLIIAAAPLKTSVDNLMNPFSDFFPDHIKILVDSDKSGTTNRTEIISNLTNLANGNKKVIIFVTYHSLENILIKENIMNLGFEKPFLLVDEVMKCSFSKVLISITNCI